MATSSFSSQGLVHGFQQEGPQTPGDLLIYSLEDLSSYDFKKFKNKLSDFPCGDKHPILKGKLEDADWIKTKDLLIDKYKEGALDVTIEVLRQIGLMGPATDLQNKRAQNAKLKKTTQYIRLEYEFSKEYKESMIKMFQRITDYNSPNGKDVSLQKRYTKLLMRKGCQKKEEKERILKSTDGGYEQIMDKRSSDEYSPTTIENLFDPDEDGFIPNIVVLQGAAGIGKTMTSKKIMLDWASGKLYIDKFDLVFYLSCREINTITGNTNLVGLLSRCCKLQCTDDLVSILRDPESHKKLLFLIDGFDELRWTLEDESEVCYDIFKETHKESFLHRLLKKEIFQQSSLIITTRSLAMKKLNTFIDDFRYVEVQGFTREDREEYVCKFFGNKEDADKALRIIRDNDILYTMCAVPITCWIVCTVIQEIKKNSDLIGCDTITSIYLRYLELLIINHSRMDGKPQAIKTCLKNLCALANEGLLKQQILFGEEDLKRHGLSLSETKSVLLNKDIFCRDIRTQTFYSFIHLSVQEFLAALYYGLDDGFEVLKQNSLPNICKGRTLSHVYYNYTHLSVAVQFLFGLLNEKVVEEFSNETDIKISIRASSAIKKWAIKDIEQMFPAHVILCLYETQNQNFIRSIMTSCPNVMLIGVYTNDLERDNNYSKQLAYCLSTLETESFSSIYFKWLIVDADCMKKLSPLLHRCEVVRFEQCKFQRRNSEYESSSGHEMDHNGLAFLSNPESKIQELRMVRCGLTSLYYDVLHSILITNKSLTKLDLSYNDFLDSGINLLCKGLKHVNCTLQELSLGYCFLSHVSCADLCAVLMKSLTKLDLAANYLQDSGIKLLCEGLQNPGCTLQELSLNGCGLTVSCCDVLHNILITNQSLTKLDLSCNDLLDSGIKLLCEGLQHPNCTLQELRLDRCGGTFLCTDALISVINTNKTLTTMDVTLDVDKMMMGSDVDQYCKVLRSAGFTVDGMNGHWSVYIQKKEQQTWSLATGFFKLWKYMYPDVKTISTM